MYKSKVVYDVYKLLYNDVNNGKTNCIETKMYIETCFRLRSEVLSVTVYNILSIIINDVLWRVYGQFITCVYIWQMSYHIFVACAFIIINVHFNNCS